MLSSLRALVHRRGPGSEVSVRVPREAALHAPPAGSRAGEPRAPRGGGRHGTPTRPFPAPLPPASPPAPPLDLTPSPAEVVRAEERKGETRKKSGGRTEGAKEGRKEKEKEEEGEAEERKGREGQRKREKERERIRKREKEKEKEKKGKRKEEEENLFLSSEKGDRGVGINSWWEKRGSKIASSDSSLWLNQFSCKIKLHP